MYGSWIPSLLRPDFTWPRPMRSTKCQMTPETPALPCTIRRRVYGLFHEILYRFSGWYCSWFNIPFNASTLQLPFGLVLKWTDRTSLEEAAAMKMARAGGIPVPKVLSCGEHPHAPFNRVFSILMTRLPGTPLENSFDPLQVELAEPRLFELKERVISMRTWPSPYTPNQNICSVLGTSLRSPRVPDHIMGPFTDEEELHNYLLSPASGHGVYPSFNTRE